MRSAVLAAWAGSPTRFREDANAEEDLRLGGYAASWFAELAQNAADAAAAAGVPGRLRVDLVEARPPALLVANTGSPLDAAGVAALAALRASAKRDDPGSVGRFGVGFAAVLALSDEPSVVGRAGGVGFSRERTAATVAALPGAAAEAARRDGLVPVLRLAWPVPGVPPAGYDTVVRLPLRDPAAGPALLAHAAAAAEDLLLALSPLVEIAVGETVLRRVDEPGGVRRVGERRWRVARARGRLDDGTASVAVEERGRREWSATWAYPLDGPLGADVLHAPTPTAEALSLPARLIATLPLEPDRRRVRPGPAADAVLAGAAAAYADLVRATPPADRAALVPEPGFPRSEPDGRLRELVGEVLRVTPWLPAAGGGEVAPARATCIDLPGAEELPALLAATGVVPGLIAATRPPWGLDVARLGPAELARQLLDVRVPPQWWRSLYAALAPAVETVPGLAAELGALPVPLLDGRLVAGPAGVLLPPPPPTNRTLGPERGYSTPDSDVLVPGCGFRGEGGGAVGAVGRLGLPGLHVADPAAAHPLLSRLGAAAAEPATLLGHPALAAAVARSVDDAEAGLDPAPLAAAVLGLLAAAPSRTLDGALALTAEDGAVARADELLLPDAALGPLLADDAPFARIDPAWVARFGREVLVAAGVVDGFTVVVDDEPLGPDHDLDGEQRWWDGAAAPPSRVRAVRDLDLVADDAWPAALRLIAADPATRAALLEPDGYTGWWLARYARLAGRPPTHWRLPGAGVLAGLYDPLPDPPTDAAALAVAGVRERLTVRDPADAADLLARLADPARRPSPAIVVAAHAALAAAVVDGSVDPAELDPPQRVRAVDGTLASTDDAVVLDIPWAAAVLEPGDVVAGGDAGALADLLDLPLASEVVVAEVVGAGRAARWAELPEVVLACAALGRPVPPGALVLHEGGVDVAVRGGGRQRVPVWRDADGGWHVADPVRALVAIAGVAEPVLDG